MRGVPGMDQATQLDEALQILNKPADTCADEGALNAQLRAIQQACSVLLQLVETGGCLPIDLLENTLEAVSRGLGSARQLIEAAQGQLRAVQSTAWSQAVLAAADTCLHSEAWHSAWCGDVGAGGKDAYLRTVALARDMLKDGLLPLLVGAAEQQSAGSGFCLAVQFKALLDMGQTAGEVVGMRDPRHKCPGLRNFSVLNVLWNGIQRLWLAVPEGVRGDMEAQGLGGSAVLRVLLGFMRADTAACHRLLDPGVGKLLLYWSQKAGHLLASFPCAGPTCWAAVLEVPLAAHRELARLAVVGGDGAVSAAALTDALHHKVLPSTMRLLVASLNAAAAAALEEQLRVMLDGLRMALSAADQAGRALPALRTSLHLLRGAASLQPLARYHCVALLGGVLDALPGAAFAAALRSGELRGRVQDAALTFLATACHAALAAVGSSGAGQACERQLAVQAWERCQQQLFLHALQPHPLTARVLAGLWGDLAAVASEGLLTSHILALHELLRLVAAAQAGSASGPGPPSPLHWQLLELLGGLLAAAPPAIRSTYWANFVQVLPCMDSDACQLACLATELRLACLVHAGCADAAAAPHVTAALQGLFTLLDQAGLVVMRRLSTGGGHSSPGRTSAAAAAAGDQQEASAYLAWLLEAVQCGVAYVCGTGAQQEGECEELLSALSTRLLYLLPKTVASGTFDFAAPCLAALSHLLPTPPARQQGGLDAELGARLVVVLAACQQRPELAVAAAALSPALAKCGAAHAELLQAVLCERGPLTQHAGLEAYVVYARASASHPDLVTAAIPPRMRDPETGVAGARLAALLHQYWQQRCPAGGAKQAAAVGDLEAAAWAAYLREEALGAAAELRREVEALRATAPAACDSRLVCSSPASPAEPAAAAQHNKQQPVGGGAGVAGGGSTAVAEAVHDVMRSIQVLDGVLAAAGRDALDAAAAATVQQCSSCLATLLGAPPT